MIKTIIKPAIFLFILLFALSCEQERLEPELTTLEGGGTLSQYTAYTINAADPSGSNVYGRVVFWKDNLGRTLVQISLYNTVDGLLHPALLIEGPATSGGAVLYDLEAVSGDTGELESSKFFIISDTSFYDGITELDSHIDIYLSEADPTVVASGNLGVNAEPVEMN
jgi:hypothetical protein